MINHAIGAAGVVSQECKAVVDQYGQTILSLLMAEVWLHFINVQNVLCFSLYHIGLNVWQAQPKKICSQVGLCTFDGTRGVR